MIDQGSQTWRTWRNKGIGSSDAAVIMNASPYSNLRILFQEKTGRLKRDESNPGTQRGHELEPVARSYFELWLDKDFPPVVAEHSELTWARASLDGYNQDDEKIILEIKAPSKANHEEALGGRIPRKYFWQIQHQFFVTGADKAIYGSYHPGYSPKGTIVWSAPDTEAMKKLVEREMWFWDLWQKDIDPSEYDPHRLSQPCAKKAYYGSIDEAREKHDIVFNCCWCVYYHGARKRMNKRSRDILENLL